MPRSCQASKKGLEKADKAFKLKGWTQEYLAGAVGCTRQTVIKFFARRSVAKHLFQDICNELNLEWGEIAELETEGEQSSRNLGMDTERGKTCEILQEERSVTQVLTPPVSLVEKQNANCKEQLVITLTGDVESVLNNPDVQTALLMLMQKASKDASLTIDRIEQGSIKITFSGSLEGLKRLEEQITSGELTEVLGMPVEDVQLLPSRTTGEEQDKLRLVQEIIAQGASGQDLSDADLSGVDLRGTNLSNADLSCADLSGADLRNGNLSGADLICSDLRGTDLRDSNLNGVYLHDVVIDNTTRISDKWRLVWEITNRVSESKKLSGADLSEGVLIGVNLSHADLRRANLRSTKLNNADLSHADLSGANLLCTDLNHANLSSANLSNTDLRIVNLSDANLSGANLSNAELTLEVDLSHADLSDANLSGANLSGANLSGANLSGADLRRANLIDAKVEEAKFGRNKGLTEALKIDLEKRGAKFEDSPGDRSLVTSGRST